MRTTVVPALALLAACSTANVFAASASPEIFAPGSLSGPASEDCLSFTPDGNTAVYDIAQGKSGFIVVAHRVRGVWSQPEIAPFSGEWYDHDPAVAPDGTFVVFASARPATPGGPPVSSGGNLWRVDRKGDGWSVPFRLPDTVNTSPRTYAPSIARDGSLYFIHPDEKGVQHIFRSQYKNGTYLAAVAVAVGDPATHQKDPAIAPDESFIVFDSNDAVKQDPDRFFIAFRDGDRWGPAIDLGAAINANNNPWGAHVGPDGRTLYYNSDRTVPVAYPRTPAQAKADFERLLSWDNGESNIWFVSLAPWLEEHRAKP